MLYISWPAHQYCLEQISGLGLTLNSGGHTYHLLSFRKHLEPTLYTLTEVTCVVDAILISIDRDFYCDQDYSQD